ncbi:MAG TPA: hypothetical protein VGA22_10115 [Gemmatimonadales bacterium]|jgi:hypothetical protein
MKKIPRLLAFTTLSTIALAGCSDNGGTNTGDKLPTADGAIVALQAFGIALSALDAVAPAGPAMVASETLPSTQVDCPSGGTATVSGSFNQTGESSGTFNLDETLNSCGVPGSGSGTIVIDGNLSLDADIQSETSGTFSITGQFDFTSGNLSGSCSIDFNITLPSSVSGSICGQNIGS